MPTLVSILIRTFSRPVQLERAIHSVLAQNYRPLQLVIVNDGGLSVRERVEALAGAATDVDLVYMDQQHQGRSAAANQALKQATGDYLLFLDDDDWIAREHVERLVSALESDLAMVAAYSDTVCVNSSAPESVLKTFDADFDSLRLVSENYLPIHAVLFRRQVVEQGCRFDTSLNLYEDWHFWIQVVQHGDMVHVREQTAYYCMDDSGVGGQHDRDFNEDYLAFIRSITPLLNDEQLLHLHYSKRALANANEVLSRVQTELQSELSQVRFELSDLSAQYRLLDDTYQRLLHTHNHTVFNRSALKYYAGRARHKAGTLMRLLCKGDFRSLHSSMRYNLLTLRRLLRFGRMAEAATAQSAKPVMAAAAPYSLEPGLDILTTEHTRHIAELVRGTLEQLSEADVLSVGPIRIIVGTPASFDDRLHLVICPQMYDSLPEQYIAFQMEQTINSRWLTDDYIRRLQQGRVVLDYSIRNVEYFTRSNVIPFEKIFHVPISNRSVEPVQGIDFEYDIAFYGDANSPRRKRFLDELGKHFNLLIVRETFGDALITQLSRAAVVVNIHYYEGALLETTRLYECLSYGFRVVSETSVDIGEHRVLRDWLDLSPIDDVSQMVELIRRRLDDIRSGAISLRLQDVPDDLAAFGFHFTRMLVAQGLAAPEALYQFEAPLPPLEERQKPVRLGLSLPETPRRRRCFQQQFPNTPVFPGIRYAEGWRGAALSYKYIARWGLSEQLPYLEVLEDDAAFGIDGEKRWSQARELFLQDGSYDILCGLVADLAQHAEVLDAFEYRQQKYIVIDRMVSMVCNGYSPQALRLLSDWSYENGDVDGNTIDRYLEAHTLRVLIPLPFIASHTSEQQSTLWKFNNSTYDDMIHDSEQRLLALYEAHVACVDRV